QRCRQLLCHTYRVSAYTRRFFFFSSRRRHTRLVSDWSSDVCSSDLVTFPLGERCFMGVIGPSGAGKSTLLGALTGTAPANHGSRSEERRVGKEGRTRRWAGH